MFAHRQILLSALTGALVLAATPAFADKGDIEVDGFVGWHIVSDSSNLGHPKNEKQVLDDDGLFGMRVGYFFFDQLSLEGELVIIPTNASGDTSDDATMFGYRAQLVYELARVRDLGGTLSLVGGIGGLTTTASDNHGTAGHPDGVAGGSTFMPQVGLNAKVAIGDDWGLRFDGRTFFGNGNDFGGDDIALDWEATFGIYKTFGQPAKAPAPVVEPVPTAKDGDGDGIDDAKDKCPEAAEDKDGFEDEDGCPDPDNDGDGVPDAQDKAPNEAEDKDGFQDEDGAPDPDNDGDGILDAQDKAPNEAEDKDGAPDPDNDGDGVLDADDKCPTELETKNGYQDNDGCADTVPKDIAKFTGAIKGINFATGKATITKGSYPVLDAAVKVLVQYPELKLEIQGHTDDVGDADKNRALSQARAEAVMAYLVGKGVAAERLRAAGFGPDKPVDPAKTAAARAKNRRVEFLLISQ